MSFSKRFTGTAAAILAAVALFPAAQRAEEEKNGQDNGVIDGHEKQITQAVAEITDVLTVAPQEAEMAVEVWGHANGDKAGFFGWRLNISDRPTPVEAPEPPVET